VRCGPYERHWLEVVDAVTVCSSIDAERLAKAVPGQRFSRDPQWCRSRRKRSFRPTGREQQTILFVGGMSWAPNVRAAVTLARKVMPESLEGTARREALACRKRTQSTKSELWPDRGQRSPARVESVSRYLSQATVTVIPLRVGGGTRLKILEAMAAGLPVVTTSLGAEGLQLVPDVGSGRGRLHARN